MRALALSLLALVPSCTDVGPFTCADNLECSASGAVCQTDGLCSDADTECESGFRYDTSAGALGGECVAPETVGIRVSVEHSAANVFTISLGGDQAADDITVEITATPELDWAVEAVDSIGDNTWTVSLGGYPIPVEHRLFITRLDRDGVELGRVQVVVPGDDIGTRVMFVSRADGTGALLDWDARPDESTTGDPLLAADEICQAEAESSGLSGTFRAVLTNDGNDVSCRVSGQAGLSCPKPSPPEGLGPWLDPRGFPVLAELGDLGAQQFITLLRYHANGDLADGSVWTGFEPDGSPASNTCSNWTTDDGLGFATMNLASHLPFRSSSIQGCGAPRKLVCAQVDVGALPLGEVHKTIGLPLFVSSEVVTGDISFDVLAHGLISADARCEALGNAAGLDPNDELEFAAYLSTDTVDAPCHVLGETGTFAGNCGLGSIPPGQPYVRVDGVLVANDITELAQGNLVHPIVRNELGLRAGNDTVWTGTDAAGARANTCDNWTDTGAPSGQAGHTANIDVSIDDGTRLCSAALHLICVAR